MSSIQEKYQRFRRWQENPFNYQDSHDRHVCCSCGLESDNNYCPRCGQRAVFGPITWRSVWRSVMDVWGVGTRSLPYTLWQLLWRPGYLIRDYISGKRQVSFPPVKMLVIVALALVLANKLLGVNYDDRSTEEVPTSGSDDFNALLPVLVDWMSNHIAWTVLIAFSFFILPIWFLFRQAPRLPRHTLPQGFYIQVFIGVQYLMFTLLLVLFFELIPSFSGDGQMAMGFMVVLGVPIMLLVDYRQLFGYGWWGTIWRVLVALLFMMLLVKMLQYMVGFVYCLCVSDWHNTMLYLIEAIGLFVFIWFFFEMVNLISNRFWRGGVSAKTYGRILVSFVALLLTSFVSDKLGVKTPFDIILGVLDAIYL